MDEVKWSDLIVYKLLVDMKNSLDHKKKIIVFCLMGRRDSTSTIKSKWEEQNNELFLSEAYIALTSDPEDKTGIF